MDTSFDPGGNGIVAPPPDSGQNSLDPGVGSPPPPVSQGYQYSSGSADVQATAPAYQSAPSEGAAPPSDLPLTNTAQGNSNVQGYLDWFKQFANPQPYQPARPSYDRPDITAAYSGPPHQQNAIDVAAGAAAGAVGNVLDKSSQLTRGGLGQIAALDPTHRDSYNAEVQRQMANGVPIDQAQWAAGQKVWGETKNPNIAGWDVPVKQGLEAGLDPSNLALAGLGEVGAGVRGLKAAGGTIKDIISNAAPKMASDFADSMGVRQGGAIVAGSEVPKAGGATVRELAPDVHQVVYPSGKDGPVFARGNGFEGDTKAAAQAAADKFNTTATPKTISDAVGGKSSPIADLISSKDIADLKGLAAKAANQTASNDELLLLRSAKTYANSLEAKGRGDVADQVRQAIGIDTSQNKAAREAFSTPGTVSKARAPIVDTPIAARNLDATLPKGLSGARPNIGSLGAPTFQSDVDKALLIAGNKGASASHDAYVSFLKDTVGLTDQEIKDGYVQVKAAATDALKNGDGEVSKTFGAGGANVAESPLAARVSGKTPLTDAIAAGKSTASERAVEASGGTSAATARTNDQLAEAVATNADKYSAPPSRVGRIMDAVSSIKDSIAGGSLNDKMNSVADVLNVPRAYEASTDLSGTLGQGAILSAGHPVQAVKSFARELSAVVQNPDTFQKVNGEFVTRSEANGFHPFWRDVGNINKEDEKFGSTVAEKFPVLGKVVTASDQAYSTYLNSMVSEVGNGIIEKYAKAGPEFALDQGQKDRLASFLEHATGRGTLPKGAQGAANLFNSLFFSPRYVLSKFQVATDTIGAAGSLAKDLLPAIANSGGDIGKVIAGLDPVDKEILRSVGAYTAGNQVAITALQLLPGVTSVDDPTATDYGRVRIGKVGGALGGIASIAELLGVRTQQSQGSGPKDTSGDWTGQVDPAKLAAADKESYISIDPWGGASQDVRLAARLIQGQSVARDGKVTDLANVKYGQTSGAHLIWDFARGKFAPGPALLTDMADRQDMAGNKFNPTDPNLLTNPLVKKVMPIGIQNILQNTDYQGNLPGLGPQGANLPQEKMGAKAAPVEW